MDWTKLQPGDMTKIAGVVAREYKQPFRMKGITGDEAEVELEDGRIVMVKLGSLTMRAQSEDALQKKTTAYADATRILQRLRVLRSKYNPVDMDKKEWDKLKSRQLFGHQDALLVELVKLLWDEWGQDQKLVDAKKMLDSAQQLAQTQLPKALTVQEQVMERLEKVVEGMKSKKL